MPYPSNGTLQVPAGVAVVALADPTTTALQKHQSVAEPLFERQACKEDVLQGQIGDCYLLAAINAILSRAEGPALIESLFGDGGNGKVIVRLYKGSYHYLRISKSVVREYKSKTLGIKHGAGKVLHGQGALWVSLLEKAYTAFMRAPAVGPVTYKHVEGGAGMDAMAAIVGGGAGIATGGALPEIQTIRDILFQLTEELSSGNKLFAKITVLRDKALTAIADTVFAGDDQKRQHADNWLKWSTENTQQQFRAFLSDRPNLEKFKNLMDRIGGGLDAKTTQLVTIWVERYSAELWAGEIGSAIYTTEQLNLYTKIQRMLSTQRSVTAGTPQELAGRVSGAGRSASEAMVEGLAAKHEYSVLDTKMDALGRRFIKVRNPWGEYGREYSTVPRSKDQKGPALLKPAANAKEAESWIELTDFTSSFQGINVGPPVHGTNRQAFVSELQSKLSNQPGTAGLNKVTDFSRDKSAPNLK